MKNTLLHVLVLAFVVAIVLLYSHVNALQMSSTRSSLDTIALSMQHLTSLLKGFDARNQKLDSKITDLEARLARSEEQRTQLISQVQSLAAEMSEFKSRAARPVDLAPIAVSKKHGR